MARIKYYYNTDTCQYERAKVTTSDVFLNLMGFLSVALVFAIAILLVYNTYFESPQEVQLKKENKELKNHYTTLQKEMDEVNDVIDALEDRDNNIYRKIYEAEPLPEEIRQAGSGGAELYKRIMDDGMADKQLVRNTYKRIDKLKKKARIQNQSFDQIMSLAKAKDGLLSSLPAIQPIDNPDLTRLSSGYGMRINPFHKGRVKHEGVDFAAPRGTPVYATGNGEVTFTKDNSTLETGYGNYIEIDHGFGYVTKYAHLDGLNVKKGDLVTRGQVIGYVGSSGGSVAPHVHYEIIKDQKKIDPINFLIQRINDHEYNQLVNLATRENQSLD
ncbi:M23 family peptidase [Fulvivirga sp. RKSG066]|uniref:peptidoglycan DD-metalloendopeptidase family protein n=1 Tax=Fulvivirga aurantia TaxID=2529383 RepID=UPI0012BB8B77|nr:peptidoglycan DD-metalloendopeptidase family protein [Fulvivirga aurantia]MTI22440.1 M23 family peptidase [Fulvivirga aurantia]